MQRKNYILRTSSKHHKGQRNAIAMILAIGTMVILATIMALSISLSSQTTKTTTNYYLHEQTVLLSKSAAEYALLRISQDLPCTHQNFNFTPDLNQDGSTLDDIYDINIDLTYIYTGNAPCTADATLDGVGTAASRRYFNITTPAQNGSVLMDITVSVTDVNITSEPICYFKRTIQKL